ncbi:hypothetical protein SJA_C1-24590 [Sphingobium indicum UT26S]|uniref:Uncharacterized protein n=1 Tax=Sphingobium indicum (strain DSM 16413 / CCM 7287 / MTCC 6362 / UT26 / NBRC 101211 / UT26S) TaxID=452662 RepID=D4Z3W1_SPHIU|nr:hypothetical protein SJA_C1-24590 [Sphingobium indicum UT26S]
MTATGPFPTFEYAPSAQALMSHLSRSSASPGARRAVGRIPRSDRPPFHGGPQHLFTISTYDGAIMNGRAP